MAFPGPKCCLLVAVLVAFYATAASSHEIILHEVFEEPMDDKCTLLSVEGPTFDLPNATNVIPLALLSEGPTGNANYTIQLNPCDIFKPIVNERVCTSPFAFLVITPSVLNTCGSSFIFDTANKTFLRSDSRSVSRIFTQSNGPNIANVTIVCDSAATNLTFQNGTITDENGDDTYRATLIYRSSTVCSAAAAPKGDDSKTAAIIAIVAVVAVFCVLGVIIFYFRRAAAKQTGYSPI